MSSITRKELMKSLFCAFVLSIVLAGAAFAGNWDISVSKGSKTFSYVGIVAQTQAAAEAEARTRAIQVSVTDKTRLVGWVTTACTENYMGPWTIVLKSNLTSRTKSINVAAALTSADAAGVASKSKDWNGDELHNQLGFTTVSAKRVGGPTTGGAKAKSI